MEFSKSCLIVGVAVGVAIFGQNSAKSAAEPPSHLTRTLALAELRDLGMSPSSLAAADFNEDGIPDLLVGLSSPSIGAFALFQGNPDAIYPPIDKERRRQTAEAPFAAQPRLFQTAVRTDFVAAGDFDSDGHCDVVTASDEGHAMLFWAGDGTGSFAPVQPIPVVGSIKALTAGEFGRADGLADLVLAANSGGTTQLIVFSSPRGAVHAKAEAVTVPGEPSSLVMGQLDHDYPMDLAFVAEGALYLIRGRDGIMPNMPNRVLTLERRDLPFQVLSMAAGSFISSDLEFALFAGDGSVRVLSSSGELSELAWLGKPSYSSKPILMGSRFVGRGRQDVVVLADRAREIDVLSGAGDTAPWGRSIFSLEGEPIAALVMRLNGDAWEDLVVLTANRQIVTLQSTPARTFSVTSSGNESDCDLRDNVCSIGPLPCDTRRACTFRAAVEQANSSPGPDRIAFLIPSMTLRGLPAIRDGTTIEGPVILSGDVAMARTNGLFLGEAASCVRNLTMSQMGLIVSGTGGHIVEGIRISPGTVVITSPANTIGGTSAAARNIISGAIRLGLTGEPRPSDYLNSGLRIESNRNVIRGNYIGTDESGRVPDPNGIGIHLWSNANENMIGGAITGAGNVVSGNRAAGIYNTAFVSSSVVGIGAQRPTGNLIFGNRIGTDPSGMRSVRNLVGVHLSQAAGTSIGGPSPLAGNLISGNDLAVNISTGTMGTKVQGNFIGTDITGTRPLPNRSGSVLVEGTPLGSSSRPAASNTLVGGLDRAEANTIAFNGTEIIADGNLVASTPYGNGGVGVGSPSSRNSVLGNSIHSNTSLGLFVRGFNPRYLPFITFAYEQGNNVVISGRLASDTSATYRVEFFANRECDPSGSGEGEFFVGAASVSTDRAAAGTTFSAAFLLPPRNAKWISATATDPLGNTTPFSPCVLIQGPIDLRISKVEPVQVIYPAAENAMPVPLVASKPVVFIVEVEALNAGLSYGPFEPIDVVAQFEGLAYRQTVSLETFVQRGAGRYKSIVFGRSMSDWITPQRAGLGTVSITVDPAEIDRPLGRIEEGNEGNNTWSVDVDTRIQRSIDIVFVPIVSCLGATNCYGPLSPESFSRTASLSLTFLDAVYPVPSIIGATYKNDVFGSEDNEPFLTANNACIPGRTTGVELDLDKLQRIHAEWVAEGLRIDYVVGVVPEKYFDYHSLRCPRADGTATGFQAREQFPNAVLVAEGVYSSTAHELGHLLGLPVSPEEYEESQKVGEPGFPARGFWVKKAEEVEKRFSGRPRTCFMGSGGPETADSNDLDNRWVDNIHYEYLFRALAASSP